MKKVDATKSKIRRPVQNGGQKVRALLNANVGKGATVWVNIDKEGASGVKRKKKRKKNYKWRVVSGDGTVVDVPLE